MHFVLVAPIHFNFVSVLLSLARAPIKVLRVILLLPSYTDISIKSYPDIRGTENSIRLLYSSTSISNILYTLVYVSEFVFTLFFKMCIIQIQIVECINGA